jgi:hypothetical protein
MTSETDTREIRLLRTFAVLADTLTAEYEVVDLLQTLVDACREFLDITDAGILLADGDGRLEVLASTNERSELIELMQLAAGDGPCIECYRTGQPVSIPDVAADDDEWSRFREGAAAQNYGALHAFPMRLRELKIGSLNLFADASGELSETDRVTAQALADVATIGILHERATSPDQREIDAQVQQAFESRAVIEQAKGVIAYQHRILVDDAFRLLRTYARSHQLTLVHVAQAVVGRTLTL